LVQGNGVILCYGPIRHKRNTRSRALADLQVSADIDTRLEVKGPRVRKGVPMFNGGDGTRYGVGPYARYSGVSTKNVTRRFTAPEKKEVNALGKAYGCHSCGVKISGWPNNHWTPDHQPPLSVAGPLHKYVGKLYPHCKECSSLQGGILAGMAATAAAP